MRETLTSDYDSRSTWDSDLDAGSTPARSISKSSRDDEIVSYLPVGLRVAKQLDLAIKTDQGGFEHCPVLANSLGKEVWRDPICLVTQVVTQRFLKKERGTSTLVPVLFRFFQYTYIQYIIVMSFL